MTIAVDLGRKATKQPTTKIFKKCFLKLMKLGLGIERNVGIMHMQAVNSVLYSIFVLYLDNCQN